MVYLALLVAGVASGFLAGLLGIGGGFVVVPVLFLLLPALGVDPGLVPKVAVATSLAAMVPTACSAVFAQHRRGMLDLDWVRRLAPGAAIGAVIGSQLTAAASGRWVAIVFAAYTGYFALRMMRGCQSAPRPPGRIARAVAVVPVPVVGALIGAISAAAGVGGATLTVPFVTSARVDMKRAVAVSSATGLAIAIAGAAGFASAAATNPSAGLTGLVHWPAALALAASATLMAPRGVAAAHHLPVRQLKRAFGALLIATCAATVLKAVDVPERFDYVKVAERTPGR
jgi:uncharacterized membrane protein YfcA